MALGFPYKEAGMAAKREGLAARRKEPGYSQEAFADLLRVDRSTNSAIV